MNYPNMNEDVDANVENIYSYYQNNLIPAIKSSVPLLFRRLQYDLARLFYGTITYIIHFLMPWKRDNFEWHEVPDWFQSKQDNFTQFLLRNFDTDHDGHINASELLHVRLDSLPYFQTPTYSRFRWFQYTFPLMDWKIGIFVWRSCGGLLLLVALITIIPGRMHVWAGRILRWPILFLTYLMIFSELLVYIMVRLFILTTEFVFATKKHRALRKDLMKAKSYNEWLTIAKQLDKSMGRDQWQMQIDDDSCKKYNWKFITELITDLRNARSKDDPMMALLVLRQCTRKNVGGVMNEDLFSFTNTGETKHIVKEFLQEITITTKWMTNKFRSTPPLEEFPITKVVEETIIEKSIAAAEAKKHVEETNNTEKKDDEVQNWIGSIIGPVAFVIDHLIGKGETIDATHKSIPQAQDKELKNTAGDNSKVIKNPCIDLKNTAENPLKVIETQSIGLNASYKQEREQVKTFLRRARAVYGRTALCLSGGGMMGTYHYGHVKALLEEDILPHIISGTSAGSAIAAFLCTRTDEEIKRDLHPHILVNRLGCFDKCWSDRIRNVYKNGCLFDADEWIDLVSWHTCGDLTFEEAYKKTGRILNVTLSSTTTKAPPVLVNYITAPDVTISSAVIASAAVPGFIKPVILRKKGADGIVRLQENNKDEAYWDGSIDQDIPTTALSEMFNCQFFLTAQCNPHIVPFFHNSKGSVAQPSRWSRDLRNDSWRGGFLLAALELYLKSDMRAKFVFLHELEAAVSFTSTMWTQIYGGTATIVPQVSLSDYFCLFSPATLPFLEKCFQNGSVAAYQNCAMMKLHYSVFRALEECLAILEEEDGSFIKQRRRRSQISSIELKSIKDKSRLTGAKAYSLNTSALPCGSDDSTEASSRHDDEYECGGFDGVNADYTFNKSEL